MSQIEQSSPRETRELFNKDCEKLDSGGLETWDHCAIEQFAPEVIQEFWNCSIVHSLPSDSSSKAALLVKDDVEQRTVNFQPTVVFNESQLSEPIHKEVNSRSGGTHHFRQRFLAYLRNYVLRSPFLAKAGQQQKGPRQPLLNGVKGCSWSGDT